MSIDYEKLRELLTTIAKTQITELNLKSKDFELTVRQQANVSVPPKSVETKSAESLLEKDTILSIPVNPLENTGSSPPEKNWVAITSPMVGTFYRAPAPGEPSYVEVNDRITSGQTVCIIEAMKLMNEIESEIDGQVMEIVAENGQPIEYGEILIWVKPS